MLIDFTKKLANGDINGKEIAAALGDGLKEEFIAPFARIEQFGKKAASGSVTYAESKQFGRDLVKAVEAVATAVTIGGAAAAKLAKAVPGLVEKVKGFGEESLERIKEKVDGRAHPNGTPIPTHNAKGQRIDNVDVPKVKHPSGTMNLLSRRIQQLNCNGFKKTTIDIANIAKNTGWKEADILQVKNHLFNNKHKFDSGEVKAFDPDYQQALAWKRLNDGDYNKNDILLLNHELFESNYMSKYHVTYETAHKEANEYYNWDAAVYDGG